MFDKIYAAAALYPTKFGHGTFSGAIARHGTNNMACMHHQGPATVGARLYFFYVHLAIYMIFVYVHPVRLHQSPKQQTGCCSVHVSEFHAEWLQWWTSVKNNVSIRTEIPYMHATILQRLCGCILCTQRWCVGVGRTETHDANGKWQYRWTQLSCNSVSCPISGTTLYPVTLSSCKAT